MKSLPVTSRLERLSLTWTVSLGVPGVTRMSTLSSSSTAVVQPVRVLPYSTVMAVFVSARAASLRLPFPKISHSVFPVRMAQLA